MLQAPDPDAHYGVRISLAELSVFNHGAAEMVLAMPRKVRSLAGRAWHAVGQACCARAQLRSTLVPTQPVKRSLCFVLPAPAAAAPAG